MTDLKSYAGAEQVHVHFEGIINPRDEVSIFTKTQLEMNRVQATQLMTALYLALSGKKVDDDPTSEGVQFLTLKRDELDEANPIELLKGYQYDEEQALAQHDAWRDEQVEA